MRALVLVVFLGGCFSPASVTCADGTVCPASLVCAPAGGGCVLGEQIAACRDAADGTACSYGSVVRGTCQGGVCVFQGCGDGIIEAGEACDDSNTVSGDGCRGDCKKVEVCGDGIADEGEACDDGNANPADSCDACKATIWNVVPVVGAATLGTTVAINGPVGVAVDRAGNFYVADTNQHRILRVDFAANIVTVLAGTGAPGYAGDGGPATFAQLDGPSALAIDGFGNVVIADTNNNVLRRVDAETGVIDTIAGASAQLSAPTGVAIDGLGTIYVADTSNNRIRAIDFDTQAITTLASGFNAPSGIAVDLARNVFVADTNGHRIARVDALTKAVTTVAGTGTAGYSGDNAAATAAKLNGPAGVAVDAGGNLYIADWHNQRVRRVAGGTITTVAGPGTAGTLGDGGAATSAWLAAPTAIAIDATGSTVYLTDTSNHRVRRFATPTGTITTVTGTGAAGATGSGVAATTLALVGPTAVASDATAIYLADRNQHRVWRVDNAGVVTLVAGTGTAGFSGDGGDATLAQLNAPQGLAADASGALYIADTSNHRIRRVDPATHAITTIAGTGAATFGGDGGPAASASLNNPQGLALDGNGNLYIADWANQRVRKIAGGTISTIAGNGTLGFSGDGAAATAAQLSFPTAVAIDPAGALLIADSSNQRIRKVTGSTISTVAGTGTAGYNGDGGAATSAQLNNPVGVAVDSTGRIYIADKTNHRIRRITSGSIATVAGTGTPGNTGDGGASSSAAVNAPAGIAVTATDDAIIADTTNRRIRRIDHATGAVRAIAGRIDPDGTGPFAQARLADPRALVATPSSVFAAGGVSGTLQELRDNSVRVVTGRYPQSTATGMLARFRDASFGSVEGAAYDSGTIYLATSTQLYAVTVTDALDPGTWTIAPLGSPVPGFRDGALATAQFQAPTGLAFDATSHTLYVADTGNHVVRAIALGGGIASATVTTIVGRPQTLGFFGDGDLATNALLFRPRAITRCPNGDLFVADTGNQRIRRVTGGMISTVLGDGSPTSGGEGAPSREFPVDTPLALACDAIGNVFATSRNTVRMLPSNAAQAVDGSGEVETIYGRAPRTTFPESVTHCLTGLAVIDGATVQIADSCTGMLVELERKTTP